MRQLPGLQMVADLGTEALTATRFRDLKELLGMMLEDESMPTDNQEERRRPGRDQTEEFPEKEVSRVQVHEETDGFRHVSEGDRLKMAIVLPFLARAAGMSEEQKDEMSYGWTPIVMSRDDHLVEPLGGQKLEEM